MGVIDYLRKSIGNAVGSNVYVSYITGGSIGWFGNNNESYLKKGYMGNVHAFTATRVYTNKAKVAPYLLSTVKNKKDLVKFEQFIRSKDDTHRVEALRIKERALEEVEDHELLNLLNNPNSYQSSTEFREAILGFYKVLGEAFIYGIGPLGGTNKGKFKQLHVIPPTMIEPIFSNNSLDPVSYYRLTLDGTVQRLEKDLVFHFKTWNPIDPLRGLSPLHVGNKTLKRNESNHTAMTKAFENGGVAHLLSSESEMAPLTQEQMDLLNERLLAKLKGPDNYQNIQATNGRVKATKIGESPADLKLIESDVHDRGIIASLFGVDPILVGDKLGSSFSNQEQAYKALVTNLIMPDLITLGEGLSRWLLPRYGNNLHLTFDTTVYPELAPDLKLLVSVYGKPKLTENEIRSVFNWDADSRPEMDDIYFPTNVIPLSRMSEVDFSRQSAQSTPTTPTETDDK